jgi:hypothetical protein
MERPYAVARGRGVDANTPSSPLARGDPVLGISGLFPHILVFTTPKNAPTGKKIGKKKGHKYHPPKKV